MREGRPIALLMIDVDHFKRYNDRHGHPAGDFALQAVAGVLKAGCRRPADLLARYGGEEFALLLPDTPGDGAEHLARQLVLRMDAMQLPHDDSPTAAYVTVSVGVAAYDAASVWWTGEHARLAGEPLVGGCDAASLLRAADEALYTAKRSGRSRAVRRDIADAGTWTDAAAWVGAPRRI